MQQSKFDFISCRHQISNQFLSVDIFTWRHKAANSHVHAPVKLNICCQIISHSFSYL